MSQQNKSKYTTVVDMIFLLLICGIGYLASTTIYDIKSSGKIHKAEKILKEADTLKKVYEAKIAYKTDAYNEFVSQKEKMNQLISELENSKYKAGTLMKYKNQYKDLEAKMKVLLNEISFLNSKKNNNNPIKKRPVSIFEKEKSQIITNDKSLQETKITEDVKPKASLEKNKYSKIKVSNVKSLTFNSINAESQVETDLSKKAKLIRVSFTLEANPTAKSENKNYYIQIINSKNNVIGKRITEYFDDDLLTYSYTKSVNYQNNTMHITEDLPYSEFEKGNYYVFIYDRNEMVGSSSFFLK